MGFIKSRDQWGQTPVIGIHIHIHYTAIHATFISDGIFRFDVDVDIIQYFGCYIA